MICVVIASLPEGILLCENALPYPSISSYCSRRLGTLSTSCRSAGTSNIWSAFTSAFSDWISIAISWPEFSFVNDFVLSWCERVGMKVTGGCGNTLRHRFDVIPTHALWQHKDSLS